MDQQEQIKIETRDFNLYYGEFQALREINLPVPERRVTALVGPSGCGKTTFLRSLNRMNDLIPGVRTTGSITLDGQELYQRGVDVVDLRRRVGMVFQRPNPFAMSIAENVAYGPKIHGERNPWLLARAFNKMAAHLERLVANLSEERGKLLTILATLADGVIVFDDRQRVILANRAAAGFLGLAPDQVEGRTLAELLLPPAAMELIAEAIEGRSAAEGEFEVHLPVRRLISAVLSPIRYSEPNVSGTLVVLRDLTTLRHLERVRQDFVANVSHELRTPLTAIKAMAETLLREGLDQDRRRRFLSTIDAECDRLTSLVNDLLTLTRLDSGAERSRAETFSLRDLIVETATGLFPAGADRRPVLALPDDLPQVTADPDRIRQILINLLDNAVRHTPAGTVFGVSASADRAQITVTVWDEGPGIPEDQRDRVFERFYRVDKARSHALGGTGLGLSIVKHLVEEYGGRVWVEDGRGAGFRFTVPRSD